MRNKTKKGFTLFEIILVVGAMGVLAALVLVAINPNRQLEASRAAKRASDQNNLAKAIQQYIIDNGGLYPAPLDAVPVGSMVYICSCPEGVDLTSALVPTYLSSIPVPPGNNGQYTVTKTSGSVLVGYEPPSILVGEEDLPDEKLPDYSYIPLNIESWVLREFQFEDIGFSYQIPLFLEDSLVGYSIQILEGGNTTNISADLQVSLTECDKDCSDIEGSHPISVSIVESADLTIKDISNVFDTQRCEYDIVETKDSNDAKAYKAQPKCETKEKVIRNVSAGGKDKSETKQKEVKSLHEIVPLCHIGGDIIKYQNPFMKDAKGMVSNLTTCNIVSGVNDKKGELSLTEDARYLFILTLSNNRFAFIQYQITEILNRNGDIDEEKMRQAHDVMRTILGTIREI